MKTGISGLLAVVVLFAAFVHSQDLGTIDPAVKGQAAVLLKQYYEIKDALVASNAETASVSAGELAAALDTVDGSKMTDAQKAHWEKLKALLRTDAVHINRNKELEHQREHFAKLSNSMYSLVYSFKANPVDAFWHYCPMKKASWLSAGKEVKNPYYGSKMENCGSVKATLKGSK